MAAVPNLALVPLGDVSKEAGRNREEVSLSKFRRDLGFVIAVAAACAVAAPASAVAAPAPYTIDVMIPATGGAAFLGRGERIAANVLEKDVNAHGGIFGRPVHFRYFDTQSNPQTALQLVSQLKASHPVVILGPSLVATCRAIAPLMKDGPVDYCFSPGIHPPSGSYAFSSTVSTHAVMSAMVRYLRLRGWTRIGVITSTDASGEDGLNELKKVLSEPANKDIKVVASKEFNPSAVSVSAEIERIKEAHPQVLFSWSTGAPTATLFRNIEDAGLDVPVVAGYGNMTYAQMKGYAKFLPKELYFPAAEWPQTTPAQAKLAEIPQAVQKAKDEMYAAFKKAGAPPPDTAATLVWDSGRIVVEGLRKLGPKATPVQLRDYIAHLSGFAGINGVYDFTKHPQRGVGISDVVVTRWNAKADNWEIVSAPGGAPVHAAASAR